MIDTKLLRQKILDLAIRGKLVPQDPKDEPASELLKKIKAEKEALIKAGKLKRDKHESFIFQGDDKRYYEQFDGRTIDISGEIPFDLPKGWAFCRMGNAIEFIGGSQPPKSVFTFSPAADSIRLIQIRDYKSDKFKTYIPKSQAKRFCSEDDIMIGRYGPPIFQILRGIEGAYNVALMKANPCIAISKSYLYYLLKDSALLAMIERLSDRTCGQDGVNMYDLKRYIIALPPLAEQKRIVMQIESLLKCVDEIDRESETLEKSITLAKQKILDLAIRGKLVPQDPKDEPASELLKKIKAEKESLIKAGKLKRDKHESFIFRGDDNCYHENIDGKTVDITGEIPFDLPQGWTWCRIGSIGVINPRNHVPDDTLVSFMPMSQLEGGYGSSYTLSEKAWKDVKTGFTHFQENDVVFAKITPCFQNRKSAVMRGLKNGYGTGTTELHVIRCFPSVFPEYVLWFVKNQTFILDAVSTIQGVVGQQRIDVNFVRDYLIPLPPLAEQRRIVSQVEKLFSVLETMRV